ncbi:MAG: glycosyl hydrolase [Williamsia sp.]|nr:glycosyl hydrolase [Williamsia sp.]
MNKLICPLCICLAFCLSVCSVFAQDRYELDGGWKCLPASKTMQPGTELSQPASVLSGWMPAVVPGTVLTTLLQNRQVPDPFWGMNNQQIPDIYSTGRDYYTYWFAKDFTETLPAKGRQVWLSLRGVNYSCDVFLNGHKLNDSTHHGMFLRQQYNITPYVRKGQNRLAVIVYPPDPVGNPNGGQGGDGMIAKNVSHQYVAGWDWIQPIRDRNTGIWDKVYIEKTGSVDIKDPHVVTEVPGTRKPQGLQQPAVIKLSADLENASAETVSGVLSYQLNGTTVSQKVQLAPHALTTVSLPDFTLQNPKLWWPNGYGRQDSYQVELRFVQDGQQSDQEKVSFGVREIRREWNGTTSSSQFSVNGQKIFLKGGNWIISDAMLRLSRERYDAEIRFHRDMNLNLIRIWGGALLERPEFYEACDKYGLLVFQDFWMSGDCNGRWNDRMKLESRTVRRLYPDDHGLFLRSVADGIRLIRNHPSLAIWCGGNEITPPDDILKSMKDSLFPRLDGTRYFFEYSNSDSMSTNILHGGGDGPYNIQPVDTFWKFRTYPFNSELGSVGTGDYESLQRFIPSANLTQPPRYVPAAERGARAVENADSVWQYHKYIGYEKYIGLYGAPTDVKDFARKAQLVNYDQYRSLMEGFSAHMWEWYTGTIIWKTQNPWTALRGQMYDYYLDPNACLYGLRSGSEPVHIMYNPVHGTLMAVNNGFEPLKGLAVTASVLDGNGKETGVAEQTIDLPASGVISASSIKEKISALSADKGAFLLLRLHNKAKQLLSENLYWMPDGTGVYSGLGTLAPVSLQVAPRKTAKGTIELTLTNKASTLAFFNRISLVDRNTKKRVLPVFYSDNYVSVLPGQQKKITLSCDESQAVQNLLVSVQGWNGEEQFFGIQ